MATTYSYKVRDRQGKLLEGSLEADSSQLVVTRLRQMGYTPIAIDQKDDAGFQKEVKLPFTGKPKLKDIAVFSRQFATMINSGLSLLRALYILADQTENKQLAGVVDQVRQDVEKGASLSQALGRHPKVFNRLYVAMVRAGETGGVLDSVLLQLAAVIEKQVELRRKIKSAMTYPVVVFCVCILIVAAMLLFIVPTFKNIYSQLGGTLPVLTRVLISISTAFKKFFPIFFVLGGLGIWGFKRWIETDTGRAVWDRVKLKVPVFGKLVHKTALTRFASTLGVLMRSGVPILEALEITSDTVSNDVLALAVKDVQAGVKVGESMAKPLAQHDIFPPMVTQMIAVGEETGAVDTMLDKIGEFYSQEVEATVNALTSLLEPLLIVFLGACVGGMVIALYMPMFNIIKLIK
ncbi:MAG: type II secretion system F family protein [Acidimicrobiia bacterium]|nr:type II secretion system F family protein [Acidimicrobiia bacterium]MBV9040997.1 type II secretion system F family protein [Acidimicrobiia bacterium]